MWNRVLLPLAIFLVLQDRRVQALNSMRDWLVRSSRLIVTSFLGIIEICLVGIGLIDLVNRGNP